MSKLCELSSSKINPNFVKVKLFMTMIKSMTGFGRAFNEIDSKIITVEIKSLNSKFFDLSLRLPNSYRDKEIEIRAEIAKELERGKIEVSISIDYTKVIKNYSINKNLAKAYLEELKSLGPAFKASSNEYLKIVMGMPEILATEKFDNNNVEWKQIKETIRKAIIVFNTFRLNEGKILEMDLIQHINNIELFVKDIEKIEPARIKGIREKLEKGMGELSSIEIDNNRFEQELIYYLEKIDISEEKVRLRSHCQFFIETLKETVSQGKKLGFIAQEVGREINTIGAKANNADIQKIVVQMKDELEKIKEQVLNIL